MKYYKVVPLRKVFSQNQYLTYSSNKNYEVGHIVQVPIGKSKATGLVLGTTTKPSFDTKDIIDAIDDTPLPVELVHTALWVSDYYVAPLAITISLLVPSQINVAHRTTSFPKQKFPESSFPKFKLTKDQQTVFNKIRKNPGKTHILRGETGSGKTLIYRELVKERLKQGKSAIVLVPEISLTPQLVSNFSDLSEHIFVTHSKLTPRQKHQIWLSILHHTEPLVVIGPRSALFMPVKHLGLVVVDEAHEPAYKNDSSPKYDAVRVSSKLSSLHNATLVLGSATPRIVDLFTATNSGASVVDLPAHAPSSTPPTTSIIDMTSRDMFSKSKILSDPLIKNIEFNLSNKRQTLLFLNRRGSASAGLCKNCGWISKCPKCYIPLILHHDKHILRCHQCLYRERVPSNCPQCGSAEIIFRGLGTKGVEKEIKRLFPNASIARFDADSPQSESFVKLYKKVYEGHFEIIIGTQTVAKGLDLPKLDTVGVVSADIGLALPDYTSSERTFQLLYQVSGRVGRIKGGGNVFIQTYNQDHPAIKYAAIHDYFGFYNYELQERKNSNYPPFTYILTLTNKYSTRELAKKHASKIVKEIAKKYKPDEILGPAPAFYERQGGKFRWQLIVKNRKRNLLVKIAQEYRSPRLQIDIDPANLL